MEYSSKEPGIIALRGILYVLSSGIILCAGIPFGNPIMLPCQEKLTCLWK